MSEEDQVKEEQQNGSDELFERFIIKIDKGQEPLRIDKFLQARITHATRNKVQRAIEFGHVMVNGNLIKSNYKIRPGDHIIVYSENTPENFEIVPEQIDLDIIYEDDDVIADLAAAIDVGGISPINIPAASASSAARRKGRSRQAILASLFVRRTLIPILLTLGVLLPVLGAVWFVVPAESPFKAVGQELPWAMLLIGPVFLVVGILNMLQVRAALRGH